MLRAALLATCMPWTGSALAGAVSLPGKATIGSESRTIAMTLGCTMPAPRNAVGVLSIGFDVPDFQTFGKWFDFEAFDGPAGTLERLTEITVARGVRLPVAGHITVGGTSVHLSVNASMRGDSARLRKVRAPAEAASAGTGALRWRQESPRGSAPQSW
ncbi:hypothetical protein [Methylobacterium terrae]|nr:hypothetical protein [Methylobacterium terrae]